MKTTALSLPLLAAGSGSAPRGTTVSGDFVSIRNRQFERHGQPYFFIGANFPQAALLADPSLPVGREYLVQELDHLRSIGVKNLRLMAGSEGSLSQLNGRRGTIMRPGHWDERLLQGLDFLLAEMAKRDMTGVLYLTNYWEWSGGMAVYVNWVTGEPIPDPNQVGGKNAGADHMNYAARFYGLSSAQELFREHISSILNRRNTIKDRFYHDDPTIMAWQLSNEPRPGTDTPASDANLPAFYSWIDETARFIKARAPRQLVSTGSEGIIGCLGKAEAYLRAHQSPAVDYATLHLWVKNWGWLKEPYLGPQYEEATTRAFRHIEQHITLADQLCKPLVMEEFGIDRDNSSTDPDSATTMRDDYFERIFQRVLSSCKAGGALQGTNFWVWSGEGSLEAFRERRSGNTTYREPADLNGVLQTDRTTLTIIRQHNAALERLAG